MCLQITKLGKLAQVALGGGGIETEVGKEVPLSFRRGVGGEAIPLPFRGGVRGEATLYNWSFRVP